MRALAFFSLVLAIVSLIFVNRSFSASLLTALRRPNRTLAGVLAAVAAILSLTLLWPFASKLFAFGPLHVDDLALTLGAGVMALVALELLKPVLRPDCNPDGTLDCVSKKESRMADADELSRPNPGLVTGEAASIAASLGAHLAAVACEVHVEVLSGSITNVPGTIAGETEHSRLA